jgi:hypothetical protein
VGEVAFERYRLPTLIGQRCMGKVCSLRAYSRRSRKDLPRVSSKNFASRPPYSYF